MIKKIFATIALLAASNIALAGGGGMSTDYHGYIKQAKPGQKSILIGQVEVTGIEKFDVNKLQIACTASNQLESISFSDYRNRRTVKAKFGFNKDGLMIAEISKPGFALTRNSYDYFVEKINLKLNLKADVEQEENIYCAMNYVDLWLRESGKVVTEEKNAVFPGESSVIRVLNDAKDLNSLLKPTQKLVPYFKFGNQSYADSKFALGETVLNGELSEDCPFIDGFYGNWAPQKELYCLKVDKKSKELAIIGFPVDRYEGEKIELAISEQEWKDYDNSLQSKLGKQVKILVKDLTLPMNHVLFIVYPTVTKVLK